jgi:hypothetical protein
MTNKTRCQAGLVFSMLLIAAGLVIADASVAGSVNGGSKRRVGKSDRSFHRSSRAPHSTPKHPGFVLVPDRMEEPISVSVRQTVVAPAAEPKQTPTNKIYIPPRWVEAGGGVLVLEPGRWIAVEAGAEY